MAAVNVMCLVWPGLFGQLDDVLIPGFPGYRAGYIWMRVAGSHCVWVELHSCHLSGLP